MKIRSAVSPSEYYQFYEALGSGTYSTVYRAENLVTHDIVAIKVIPKNKLKTDEDISLMRTEFSIYKKLDHPHIIHFYDAFEDQNYIYFVLEHAEKGEISRTLQKGPISESQARMILFQLLSALDYLHNEVHIIHRDIKLENIIIDHFQNTRLTDFGLSTFFNPDHPFVTAVVGSPVYVAPELVLRHPYSTPIDIWCLGVLLYTMIVGHYPFYETKELSLAHMIVESQPIYPESLSSSIIDLLSHLLDKNPQTRYNIAQIRNHPWCNFRPLNFLPLHVVPSAAYPDAELDPKVIQQMEALHVNVSNLKEELINSIITRETAIYRILKTNQISNELPVYESNMNQIPLSSSGNSVISSRKRLKLNPPKRQSLNPVPYPLIPISKSANHSNHSSRFV